MRHIYIFFAAKYIDNIFLKTVNFVKNLGMTQIVG